MARILVVDDEPMVRRTVADILLRAGHDVAVAANGRDGEAAVGEGRPDIVILDILMPERDGIETILWLQRDHPGIGILAVSSAGLFDFLGVARKLGAHASLDKPFSTRELLASVNTVLDRR
jgi:DNA-binding response OmpR family regulator